VKGQKELVENWTMETCWKLEVKVMARANEKAEGKEREKKEEMAL
jgi:hypothetical protein